MKVLVGKCFGLGNAVLTVPLIKSLFDAGHDVDVLVGSLPDDGGAFDVFRNLSESHYGYINSIYFDKALGKKYDCAIMSIPFDGRWMEGHHFRADRVLDGRTRPDPSTVGLVSWKKHEIDYILEGAEDLLPKPINKDSTSFIKNKLPIDGTVDRVYLGIGYKKDDAGFWLKKHWGNKNYTDLVGLILNHTSANIVMTGNKLDFLHSIKPILQRYDFDPRIEYEVCSFDRSFELISRCQLYVGNDTGMMHVAASENIPCVSLFFLENSIIKNPPWSLLHREHVCLDGSSREISVQEVYDHVRKYIR